MMGCGWVDLVLRFVVGAGWRLTLASLASEVGSGYIFVRPPLATHEVSGESSFMPGESSRAVRLGSGLGLGTCPSIGH